MNIALIACFFGGLILVCWSWWFNARESAKELAEVQERTRAMQPLIAEFRAVFNHEQLEMAAHMEKIRQAGHFAEATMLVDRLLRDVTDHNSSLYVHLLLMKVDCLLHQNQIDQAEKTCDAYLQENASKEQKLRVLDGFASYILYQSSAASFARAERFARMGLEIAPGTLTMKGTLGSILVEQGNYAQGELLLHDCLHDSNALHDRAIASFYLAVIKMHNGDVKGGKRLIKRAMKIYPEAWMVAKGTALLK